MIGTLTVGNIWDKPQPGKIYVYIGRAGSALPQSPLYNPFHINAHCSRDEACDQYEVYLQGCIENQVPTVVNELERIGQLLLTGQDVTLQCYCKRQGNEQRCHGDSIKALIDRAIQQQQQ